MMLINGQASNQVAVTDRGLQYGDGLFETIAIRKGEPEHWDAHLQRLSDGCQRLSIPMPDSELLAEEAAKLAEDMPRAVLKIIVTRGSGGRGYRPPVDPVATRILAIYDWPDYPTSHREQGVRLRLCHTLLSSQPGLAGIKHLNRLEQVLARSEWQDENIAEGLMSDASGCVVEGTMSNYFIVKDGILQTPLLSDCGIAGIMRAHIIDLATHAGLGVLETSLRADDIYHADELFICNSIIGLWPVTQLGAHHFAAPGVVTRQLQGLLK